MSTSPMTSVCAACVEAFDLPLRTLRNSTSSVHELHITHGGPFFRHFLARLAAAWQRRGSTMTSMEGRAAGGGDGGGGGRGGGGGP
eukprot:8761736-Pyramimonas_sp.AAC.1